MIKNLLFQIQKLRNHLFPFFLVVSLSIASIHLAISYTLLKPSFWPFPSCSPNVLSYILNGPGAILIFLLGSSADNVSLSFLAMAFSSSLYGIGAGLLLSSEQKTAQPIGIVLLTLLILVGCLALSLVGVLCA